MGKFNSEDHYIYCCGQDFLRRNGVALIVKKRVRNAVLGCNLKNKRVVSVSLVIQVYAWSTNAEEGEVEWSYEDLQDSLELTLKKDVLFITGDWNAKVESQVIHGVTGKFDLGVQKWSRAKANRVLPEDTSHGDSLYVQLNVLPDLWSPKEKI